MAQNTGQVESVKITTLLDDYAGYETPYYAQHGISLLVDVCSGGVCKRVLLDVGQSAKFILYNMELLSIDPGAIDAVGEVERTVDFEKQGIGTYNLEDGHISGDSIVNDLSMVVNVQGKGLVVVMGCSHAGIVNIIKHARRIAGVEKVAAVIGGFHLIEASGERIEKTAAALKEMDIDLVVPGHCTGLKASAEIARVLGDRFEQLHVGKIVQP